MMREIYAMVHNGPAPLISRDELFQAAQGPVSRGMIEQTAHKYVESGMSNVHKHRYCGMMMNFTM
ncbi:MAG: hypothetical protein D6723_08615 [Acidobacteria bacterium]|nr:MAG: hypothetical protein D6723_08615 [Acidobacteriota bacterium]